MKVKLLKKIRKQYSIVHYPNGFKSGNYVHHINRYVIYGFFLFEPTSFQTSYPSKEYALSVLMDNIRDRYKKYSRKYAEVHFKGVKVWYNK